MPMTKLSGNKEIKVLQFLDAYEKQQSLWNPSLESYKNKQARDEAYLNIIRELNLPSLTVQDVKLKVKSIRTTYTKELRALTKCNEEGKGYNPKLFWFSKANSFLKNVSLSRERKLSQSDRVAVDQEKSKNIFDVDVGSNGGKFESNLSAREKSPLTLPLTNCGRISRATNVIKSNITSTISTPSHETNSPSAYECSSEKKQHLDFSTPIINTPSEPVEVITNVKMPSSNPVQHQPMSENSTEDEYELFCHSVAAQLRSIPDPYSRAVAKLKIQQILFEAETGHYANSLTIPVN